VLDRPVHVSDVSLVDGDHTSPLERLTPHDHGFTLVEILIVVVILGILAAIITSAVGNASRDARRVGAIEAAMRATTGITLYREQTGRLPNLVGPDWTPLTAQSTVAGVTVGPFLNAPPRNLLDRHGNPSCLTDGNSPTLSINTCTFLYDYNGGNGTGRFIAGLDP
jgi:prepilin-type N-terminal cleavage/methylation domain-containing protein